MSQISLGDMKGGVSQNSSSPTEMLALLMNGIGKHAVAEDADELQRFQERINTEAERLKSADQMRSAVDAVIQLMAQHNETVQTDHKAYATELTKAMRMMVETIGHVSKSSQAAVHQLSVIEKNLEEVTATSDATKLRSKLGVCLKMIREQSETLQAQSEQQLNTLKTFVSSSPIAQQQASLMEKPIDPVTNLPTRAFAENLIQERLSSKTDCMVGMVIINRFGGLAERFGQSNVDDLVRTVAKQLAQRLPEATTLCRWSASSFVAITEIVSSYAESSQQWRKVNGLKVEKQIDDDSRTAFVVLNTSVMVEHLRPLSSKRALIQNLDRFALLQSGELAA